jgi:hypothetical protein
LSAPRAIVSTHNRDEETDRGVEPVSSASVTTDPHDIAYQPLAIRIEDLTVRRLADWPNKARHADAVDDRMIVLEATDGSGNPIAAHDIFIESTSSSCGRRSYRRRRSNGLSSTFRPTGDGRIQGARSVVRRIWHSQRSPWRGSVTCSC